MTFRFKTNWRGEGGNPASLVGQDHLTISMSVDQGKTYGPQRWCGDSWCRGSCGFPALVHVTEIDHVHGPLVLKAHSAMVACGPVWQPFRVKWVGDCEPLPPELQELPDLLKLMWW